jgi:hypothetical protein
MEKGKIKYLPACPADSVFPVEKGAVPDHTALPSGIAGSSFVKPFREAP